MKNVLITGATGFIGVELVRRLSDMGIRPRVLVRRPHRASLLASYEIEPIQGDLLNAETLERAVDGVDTVFHLGGRASFESYRRLRPTIVEATAQLGGLAAAAGVEHFVFASSLFVYGNQQTPIDATTSMKPMLGYGQAKLEAEERLTAIAAGSGMTLASLRLPHVYGPQSILFRQVQSGLAIFPGGMANQCGQLHVADAARIIAAVGHSRWQGGSAVADSMSVTWTQYFDLLQTLYPYFRLITLPRWFGYAGASALEPLLSRQNRPTLYTKDTVVGFNLNLPVSPKLVWRDIGLEPDYPSIYEGIPAVLDAHVHYRWRHPMLDRRWS
ncbi:MAG: NAD-dependent epimerase/dehydratase family protein [Acidimicrobiia bacterium]